MDKKGKGCSQLVARDGLAQPVQEARPHTGGAHRAAVARCVASLAAALSAEDVSGATTADVARGLLLQLQLASVLLIKGDGGSLGGEVGVSGSASSRVEAGSRRRQHLGKRGNARGGSGGRSAEVVARTTSAGMSEVVLSHGGVRLCDSKVAHGCVSGGDGSDILRVNFSRVVYVMLREFHFDVQCSNFILIVCLTVTQ